MSRVDEYRRVLAGLEDWIPYLLENSGLPGPRGNLELAHAVAREGTRGQFEQFLGFSARENTPEVFLIFCGLLGLGKLAVQEDPALFARLREYASDPRWRVREAVATGLQLAGDQDMPHLLKEMHEWSRGNWYEKRAAAAALAEPRLLRQPEYASGALRILDHITAAIQASESPHDEAFKVLRQGMGYCWSVVVAALPAEGKPLMEKWLDSPDPDVRWIMKENLKKNRLLKMDAGWVRASLARIT
jgi:hypothetical protein